MVKEAGIGGREVEEKGQLEDNLSAVRKGNSPNRACKLLVIFKSNLIQFKYIYIYTKI